MQGPKSEDIRNLFASVASGYDKANDAMTFGMAHLWRRKLVVWSEAKAGDQVLDCATGTGDLALEFKRVVGSKGRVLGTDFCEEMLDIAPPKAKKAGLDIDFQIADVTKLQFDDDQFDIASISYGIRNVNDPVKALREMARVVRPGGKVMILETGDSPGTVIKPFIDLYFRKVIPRVGGWITGKRSAYEYLNNSSRGFPSRERFLELMQESGKFESCDFRVLMGGASFIYRGIVK